MVNVKTFHGNYYEVGKQQGEVYKKYRMTLKDIEINPKIFKGQYNIYKKYYPEILEELRGTADALGLPYEKVVYYFLCDEYEADLEKDNAEHKSKHGTMEAELLKKQKNEELQRQQKYVIKDQIKNQKGCSIFSFKVNGNVFLGRSYDWSSRMEKFMSVFRIMYTNKDKYSFCSISDGGLDEHTAKTSLFTFNGDDLINTELLYIGYTYSFCKLTRYGLTYYHYMRYIVENCKTLKDVVKIIVDLPLCSPRNFFVCDKQGNTCVIEHNTRIYKVLYPENNILIQTNHSLHPELSKTDLVLQLMPFHDTYVRWFELYMLLNQYKKGFNLRTAKQIMRTTSRYVFAQSSYNKTIWNFFIDINNKKYHMLFENKEKTRFLDIFKFLFSNIEENKLKEINKLEK